MTKFLSENKSRFIVGIFNYETFPKKMIGKNIENGFFDKIIKSVEFHADEIVAFFTCLRLEIYICTSDEIKLEKIREFFLKNKFKVLCGKKNIINRITQLCSGRLSEIIGELQIETQVMDVFESQLEEKSKLKEMYKIAFKKAVSFRKEKNFYNNENYATIALKFIDDLTESKIKGLLIFGAGMISKEFVKACNYYKKEIAKFFITDIDRKKSKDLRKFLLHRNVEIINPKQINNILRNIDVIFAAAGGKYKICNYIEPLLIIDITSPPIFSLKRCPKTKIITMYDEIYKRKISQINDTFMSKYKQF